MSSEANKEALKALQHERNVMRAALEQIASLQAKDFSGAQSFSAECFVIATTALQEAA